MAETPTRQIGRINDQDWEYLKRAAAKNKTSFTHWALEVLKREAMMMGVPYPKKKK